jgi:hypothetical protein
MTDLMTEVNPMICSKCSTGIKILGFVTHKSAIHRILRGIGWPTQKNHCFSYPSGDGQAYVLSPIMISCYNHCKEGGIMEKQNEPQKKIYRAREARLTIDCSTEQKKKIKMLAASKSMSITDFMLGLVEEKFTWCPVKLSHIPNAQTTASIEASERGEGIKKFKSIGNLFEDLGI